MAKGYARTFGQDLMRGEHIVGEREREREPVSDTTRSYTSQEWVQEHGIKGNCSEQSGTSIFDPVLCELAYRWFCPPGGAVLDPFAGGSVRGVVAAVLGHPYTGIDLRPEQIAANAAQWADIGGRPLAAADGDLAATVSRANYRKLIENDAIKHGDQPPAEPDADAAAVTDRPAPQWLLGDACDVATLAPGEYDLVFSCPPYGDLERYSDDPRDLSTMDAAGFEAAYRRIIAAAVALLRPNRFAVFVVGDVRDKRGFYRNLPGLTIAAFEAAGATLYNEAVLVTAVGSLPIRIGKQFAGGRKLGKTHQNVLVFYRGDPKRIGAELGPVEAYEPEPEPESPES